MSAQTPGDHSDNDDNGVDDAHEAPKTAKARAARALIEKKKKQKSESEYRRRTKLNELLDQLNGISHGGPEHKPRGASSAQILEATINHFKDVQSRLNRLKRECADLRDASTRDDMDENDEEPPSSRRLQPDRNRRNSKSTAKQTNTTTTTSSSSSSSSSRNRSTTRTSMGAPAAVVMRPSILVSPAPPPRHIQPQMHPLAPLLSSSAPPSLTMIDGHYDHSPDASPQGRPFASNVNGTIHHNHHGHTLPFGAMVSSSSSLMPLSSLPLFHVTPTPPLAMPLPLPLGSSSMFSPSSRSTNSGVTTTASVLSSLSSTPSLVSSSSSLASMSSTLPLPNDSSSLLSGASMSLSSVNPNDSMIVNSPLWDQFPITRMPTPLPLDAQPTKLKQWQDGQSKRIDRYVNGDGIGQHIDVTDVKALAKSKGWGARPPTTKAEAILASIFHDSMMPLGIVDFTGIIIDCNARLARQFGFHERAELTGYHMRQLLAPEALTTTRHAHEALAFGQLFIWRGIKRYQPVFTKRAWEARVTVWALRRDDNHAEAVMGLIEPLQSWTSAGDRDRDDDGDEEPPPTPASGISSASSSTASTPAAAQHHSNTNTAAPWRLAVPPAPAATGSGVPSLSSHR